ncbi:MAG: DUF47 domain-containing protein [Fimbriimonadaceae bacterium]
MALSSRRDGAFFALLERQAGKACEAARTFRDLAGAFDEIDRLADRIAEIEHEADVLTHELADKVAATFITPLDKEDLRDLSQALDDITDCIEAAVSRVRLYRLRVVREDLVPLADLLVQVAEATRQAVEMLHRGIRKPAELKRVLIQVHDLENRSDVAFRQALADLFDEDGLETLMVIKWKEIYDRIETAVDKCEDVAKIVGSVLVKYA